MLTKIVPTHPSKTQLNKGAKALDSTLHNCGFPLSAKDKRLICLAIYCAMVGLPHNAGKEATNVDHTT